MPRANRIARVLSTKIVGNSVEILDQEEPRRVQVCISSTGFVRESARLQAPRAILCPTGVDDQGHHALREWRARRACSGG
jgi:hypothetical protein